MAERAIVGWTAIFCKTAEKHGFRLVDYDDCTPSMQEHYGTVDSVLCSKREQLLASGKVSCL